MTMPGLFLAKWDVYASCTSNRIGMHCDNLLARERSLRVYFVDIFHLFIILFTVVFWLISILRLSMHDLSSDSIRAKQHKQCDIELQACLAPEHVM